MEERHLYVFWKDNPPSKAMKVFRVVDSIDYEDGKFVFQIPNGSIVRIYPDQIIRIGISKDADECRSMIEKAKEKNINAE